MQEKLLRASFVILCALAGYLLVSFHAPWGGRPFLGLALGMVIGLLIMVLEEMLRKVPSRLLTAGLFGFFLGLILAKVLLVLLSTFLPSQGLLALAVQGTLMVAGGYLGTILAVDKGREFNIANFIRLLKEQPRAKSYKILDTSVIIDGRIADVCETGFLEGSLVIPQFILRELQHIADSSDPLKRNRGRRGLDILQKMQKKVDVHVEISDMDFPEIREVDAKIVALAKALNAKIVTNDFNLNKVAELHGVAVLNINELANALRPVVLPGEEIRVYVLKEGKEYNQGVAYLDDGTMVVIDNGRRYIGQTIDVCVTSVLQTTAGRMIFSRLKEEAEAA